MITEIARSGITIVLVEQNARMALKLSQYGYVLETGRLALEDRPPTCSRVHGLRAFISVAASADKTWRCLTLTQKVTALDCSPSEWITVETLTEDGVSWRVLAGEP